MRAPVGSDAFEYYGNMTYASGTATATISLNGKYKAILDIGTAPEVETSNEIEIIYTPTPTAGGSDVITVVCSPTVGSAHIYRLTAKDSDDNDVILDESNFTVPAIYRPNDSDSRLYTSNYTGWPAGTHYGTAYNDYSINIYNLEVTDKVIFQITGVKLKSISIHQLIHQDYTSWDLENAKIKYNDDVLNDGVFTRTSPDPNANTTSTSKIFGVVDTYTFVTPTTPKSSVTGATLAFDGYDQLTLTATGTNVDTGGFGYLVERSDDNSTWTQSRRRQRHGDRRKRDRFGDDNTTGLLQGAGAGDGRGGRRVRDVT